MPLQSNVLFAAIALVIIDRIHAAPVPFHPSFPSLAAVEPSACLDGNNCRTTWDIVWSCATTIFLCTWVSFHPSVPEPTFTKWRVTAARILAAIISFMAPEWVVANAAAVWWQARHHKSPFQGWTQTHTQFTLMGGFVETRHGGEIPLDLRDIKTFTPETHPELLAPISNSVSKNPSPARSTEVPHTDVSNRDSLPLTSLPPNSPSADNKPPQFSSDPLSPTMSRKPAPPQYRILVTDAVILDKSKTNALTKFITVAQTSWFIVQFITRWAAHQPRTQLEVMTVAYAVLNAVLYALWRNKPYNVDEPINVSGRAHDRTHSRTIGIWAPRSLVHNAFQAIYGETFGIDPMVMIVFMLIGALFGGLHCLAWGYHFPTEAEAKIWRVCAVYCIFAPAVGTPFSVLALSENPIIALPGALVIFSRSILAVVPIGYIICRMILLALTLSCLRGLPADVFETTAWTTFLPHISY